MTNFVSKNKAAQLKHSSKDFGDLSSKDLQKMVHTLPQYSEQIDKLSLHVEIARTINKTIMEQGLRDLGQLEQDLTADVCMTHVVLYFMCRHHETMNLYL
ncbi:protein transport Sec1b isoform X1 [Arabidopsis lyrata subsp. lyrata]|nr:protein transport Sec1b isoform X1 [Arabidopsis lyrata subsp. lyrata]|eukprot:XP_020876058.1 protein transport Sec1b isoform X1 [Arabidopsis lyrata subsp. lyrata]